MGEEEKLHFLLYIVNRSRIDKGGLQKIDFVGDMSLSGGGGVLTPLPQKKSDNNMPWKKEFFLLKPFYCIVTAVWVQVLKKYW